MTSELVVLITALVGLATALLTFFATRRRETRTITTVEPPTDPDDDHYVETTIWERAPSRLPPRASNYPKVLSVVGMKGGVGKTTIAANLAAYFSSDPQNRRVLLIDFDYQSNLSVTVMHEMNVTDVAMTAHKLLVGKEDPTVTILRAPANQLRRRDKGRISIFTAHYSLATVENELMAEWLKSEFRQEIRFNVQRYLSTETFLRQFDLIILDCPPRLTTATINALTASTHVLIPTVLDNLSAPASAYLSRQLVRMRPHLFPSIKLAGVVPSITSRAAGLTARELKVADALETELNSIWPTPLLADPGAIVMKNEFIPRTAPIGDAAGLGFAYFRNAAATAIFSRLGAKIAERLDI